MATPRKLSDLILSFPPARHSYDVLQRNYMSDAAERFASEFAGTDFRHSSMLMGGIHDGSITTFSVSEDSSLPASHYLDIYRLRLKGLKARDRTPHVDSMQNDVSALCDGLSSEPTEPCDLWIFQQQPYYNFSVWVGRESRSILGCIRGVDNRLVDDKIRADLWGEAALKSNKENKS